MDIIKNFWYLVNVERQIKKNDNSIRADVTDDSIEND
jgi:hypothetical protein